MKVGIVCKLFGGRQHFNKGKATRFGPFGWPITKFIMKSSPSPSTYILFYTIA